MNPTHFIIGGWIAASRQDDFLRAAEQARLVAQAANRGSARSPIGALRRQVGALMVRAGERIQGAHRRDTGTAVPSAGTLRMAR